MEIGRPTCSLSIQKLSGAAICLRCSEPLSSQTQIDICVRCQARWGDEVQRKRSVAMETLSPQTFIPTIAEAFTSGHITKEGEPSSNAQIRRVPVLPRKEQWPVSSPLLRTQEPPFDMRQLSMHVSDKRPAKVYPEVQGRWFQDQPSATTPTRDNCFSIEKTDTTVNANANCSSF
ncbi:hypothetical protein H2248_001689 [Termitomyces sp. 'cryptogamus']|nr:hypothetical protein H2248_001689 [Termitomyces sp. 'cryptogamus']